MKSTYFIKGLICILVGGLMLSCTAASKTGDSVTETQITDTQLEALEVFEDLNGTATIEPTVTSDGSGTQSRLFSGNCELELSPHMMRLSDMPIQEGLKDTQVCEKKKYSIV